MDNQRCRMAEEYEKLDMSELRKKAEELGLGKPRLGKTPLIDLIVEVELGHINPASGEGQQSIRAIFGNLAFEEDPPSVCEDNISDNEKEIFQLSFERVGTDEEWALLGNDKYRFIFEKLIKMQKELRELFYYFLRII